MIEPGAADGAVETSNPVATTAANLVAERPTVRSPEARRVCTNTLARQCHHNRTDNEVARPASTARDLGVRRYAWAVMQCQQTQFVRSPQPATQVVLGALQEIVCCPFPLSRIHCTIVLVKAGNCARMPFVTYRRDRLLVGGDQDFDAIAPRSGCLRAHHRPLHRERRWSDRRSRHRNG